MKKLSSLLIVLSIVFSLIQKPDVSASQLPEEEIIPIYAMNVDYLNFMTIPDNYPTEYTITVPDDGCEYKVESLGRSTEVDGFTVRPKSTETTIIGGVSGTVTTKKEYTFESSKVVVHSEDNNYCKIYTFDVRDYSDVFVDEIIERYVSENIKQEMSAKEKLEEVAKYIASFDYNEKHQSLKGMLINNEGGDCWASTDAAIQFCEYLGYPARVCSDEYVSIFYGGHTYAVAYADGKHYMIEAGYAGKAPRPYYVDELETPFVITALENRTCEVKTYIGCADEVVIPEQINGYTVTSIGPNCFYLADGYIEGGIKKVTLPETVEKLSASCFYDCEALEELNIPSALKTIEMSAITNCRKLDLKMSENNDNFIAENGMLFTKDKKELVCAYAPADDCIVPEGVEDIADCAFYNIDLNSIKFPSTLKDIGYCAFCYSSIKNPIVLPESVEGIGYGAFHLYGGDITILNNNMAINNTLENNLRDQEDGATLNVNYIYAFSGSTAESYANNYDIDLKTPCPAVLETGMHSFPEKVTCADSEKLCKECSGVYGNNEKHEIVYRGFSYYSNTNDPYYYYDCKNCDYSDYDSLYLSNAQKGDIDFDGRVSAADARLALRFSAKLEYFDALEKYMSNVNGDEFLTAGDSRLLLRYSAGLEMSLDA